MDDKLKLLLLTYGYSNLREIQGKGICGTHNFLFTTAIVVGLDSRGYVGRYCYATTEEAVAALAVWRGDGDPPGGWIVYKGEGGDRHRLDEFQPKADAGSD